MGYLGSLVGLVLIGLLVGGGLGDRLNMNELAKKGAVLFTMISYGQIVLICLLAPIFISGAIGPQKMTGTYDLLLSTPLSNLQIVLGSLFGRLFFVWVLLASGLPLFSVLLIFGGVPLEAIWVSFVVAGLSALVMGSVAVALSVWRAGGQNRVFGFVITVGAYLVVTYTVDLFLLRPSAVAPGMAANTTTWLTPLHPVLVLESSLHSATYRLRDVNPLGGVHPWLRFYFTRPLLVFVILSGMLSSVLILTSTVMLRRIDRLAGFTPSWWRNIIRKKTGARLRTPRRVWANPVAWRESKTRNNRVGWVLWRLIFLTAGLGAGIVLLVLYHVGGLPKVPDLAGGGVMAPDRVFRLLLITLLQLELAVIVLIAVYTSAGCVSREREEGTIDLILTTPMTSRQYIWGKLRGLVAFLAIMLVVPVATVLMVSLYTTIGQALSWPQALGSEHMVDGLGSVTTKSVDLITPEAGVLLFVTMIPFVALCVVVGMSWSLKAKSVLGAVAPSVAIVGCLITVMGFCGSNLAANVPLLGGALNAFSPVTHLMVLVDPWHRVADFGFDPVMGRLGLVVGSVLAGGGYSMIVYVMILTMVQSFDQTVRRLGTD